jgi:hypothetical protein
MGTGKYPVKDAGYMHCIRFENSKKTLTRGAGLYIIDKDQLKRALRQLAELEPRQPGAENSPAETQGKPAPYG